MRSREDYSNSTYATYVYDAVGRTLQIRQATVGGTDIERSFYSYDPVGRPLQKATLRVAHTYAYDAIGQLIGESTTQPATGANRVVTHLAWTYDPTNRRTLEVQQGPGGTFRTTYAYDVADQLLTAGRASGTTTYSYDPNGSRIFRVQGANRTTYQWDGANRLSNIQPPGVTQVYEQYRSDGLRYRQTEVVQGTTVGEEITLWDESTPLAWTGRTNYGKFLASDSTTQGTWLSPTQVYGTEGYWFLGTTSFSFYVSLPSWASVSGSGGGYYQTSTGTTDVRALQKTPPATDRIAVVRAQRNPFSINVNLRDGVLHRVSLYCADYNTTTRVQRVEVRDAVTGEVLDSVTISNFNGGRWLTFLVRGNVRFVFIWISGQDAVYSGVFIDPYTGPNEFNGPSEQFVAEPVSGRLLRSVGTTSQAVPVARQFHQDALGSVETVSRAAGSGTGAVGSVEGDYRLDAFGNALPGSATDATVRDNPFTYLGGLGYWNEPDLGLSYVRARWLDSATGSWLSVDPVEGEPRYSYADNAPTYKVDPSGTQSIGEIIRQGLSAYVGMKQQEIIYLKQLVSGIRLPGMSETVYRSLIYRLERTWQSLQHKSVGLLPFKVPGDRQMWQSGRGGVPKLLRPLYPPYFEDPGAVLWMGGAAWGFKSVIEDNVYALLTLPLQIQIFELEVFFNFKELINDVWKAVNDVYTSVVALLNTQWNKLDAYDLGKIAGILFALLLLLMLDFLLPELAEAQLESLLSSLSKIGQNLKGFQKFFNSWRRLRGNPVLKQRYMRLKQHGTNQAKGAPKVRLQELKGRVDTLEEIIKKSQQNARRLIRASSHSGRVAWKPDIIRLPHITRRAQVLAEKAASIAGLNLSDYVDAVVVSSTPSAFYVDNGVRFLQISLRDLEATEDGRLLVTLHEIGHAEIFARERRAYAGWTIDEIWEELEWEKPFGSKGYAYEEMVVERLARMRVRRYLGSLRSRWMRKSQHHVDDWYQVWKGIEGPNGTDIPRRPPNWYDENFPID